jgi:hypothetical protein
MTHYSKYKDYVRRQKLKKNFITIFVLKYIIKNLKITKNIRFKVMLKIQKFHKYNQINKIKNRCIVSTKVRSISRVSNLTNAFLKKNIN